MLPIYEGIPELFEFAAELLKRRPQRDSLTIVAYHQLGNAANSANRALVHYLTLTLEEHFLQNSSRGTPYQKWAKVSNENFQRFDKWLHDVMPVLGHLCVDDSAAFHAYEGAKTASNWCHQVRKNYTSCMINVEEPFLELSSINLFEWLDSTNTRFQSPAEELSFVSKTLVPLDDRTVLAGLQLAGLKRVNAMSETCQRLAHWLLKNYTIEDATTILSTY